MQLSDEQLIAQSLLKINAVRFQPAQPITYKFGLKAPVYVDNRCFPFYPEEWAKVIEGFQHIIANEHLDFDVVAGIETAGIPHSAALGFFLKKPSAFVRKQVKDHGTKKRVEGGVVDGLKVLLVEDHITTGGSSLSGVEALRAEGAVVTDCLSITSCGFAEANEAFAKANVKLHVLTSFSVILDEALKAHKFTEAEMKVLQDWFQEPWGWAARHGFEPSVRL